MVYGKCFVTVLAVVGVALAAPKSEEMSNVSISTRTRRRFIDDNLRAPIPSLPTTAIPFARCRRSLLPLGTGPNNAVAPAETSNVRNTFRPAVPRNRELPMFVCDSYGPPDVTRVSAKVSRRRPCTKYKNDERPSIDFASRSLILRVADAADYYVHGRHQRPCIRTTNSTCSRSRVKRFPYDRNVDKVVFV